MTSGVPVAEKKLVQPSFIDTGGTGSSLRVKAGHAPARYEQVDPMKRSIRFIETRSDEHTYAPLRTQCYLASCCRYLWANAIAMLPSPTAEATRLTGLNLTSPQANTPGTLDSRR